MKNLKISVIINTYNRASYLKHTLESFRYQHYDNFEIIVVNGPSTDETKEIVSDYSKEIRYYDCPEANLSVSRNIGLNNACGEVVFYIDDDAIPETNLLMKIADAYIDESIGAVGGPIYDNTGYTYQCFYTICDRLARGRGLSHINPTDWYNFPGTFEFPSITGVNSSFRKDLIVSLGGFDELYSYFLEETDMCLRVVDSGYIVKCLDDAFVYHKFAPSHLRDEKKIVKDLFPSVRSTVYFVIKHGIPAYGHKISYQHIDSYIEQLKRDCLWHYNSGNLTLLEYEANLNQIDNGITEGKQHGFENKELNFISNIDFKVSNNNKFKKFPTKFIDNKECSCIVYLTQNYPPENCAGIARLTQHLSEELAQNGHEVHVICRSSGVNTVDLVNGVWVHRIVQNWHPNIKLSIDYNLSQTIIDYAYSAYLEVKRIQKYKTIDLVSAPIWDHEGIFCMLDQSICTNITLHTTYGLSINYHKNWLEDVHYYNEHIQPNIELEKYVFKNANYLLANSTAIIDDIEKKYKVDIDKNRIVKILHGTKDIRNPEINNKMSNLVEILFVGRLEKRKGIDVLIRAIERISIPNIKFIVVGEDGVDEDSNQNYSDIIKQTSGENVDYYGHVTDKDLERFYNESDILVVPSRYESFGLVAIEGMSCGIPIIATDSGGLREIVKHGENGYLFENENHIELSNCIETLIKNKKLRKKMGSNSRKIYEKEFTVSRMVCQHIEYYKSLSKI